MTSFLNKLLRLAKVDAVVRRDSKFLVPGIGLGASILAKVTNAVYEQSWLEIVARNEDTLEERGWTLRSGLRSTVMPEVFWA